MRVGTKMEKEIREVLARHFVGCSGTTDDGKYALYYECGVDCVGEKVADAARSYADHLVEELGKK